MSDPEKRKHNQLIKYIILIVMPFAGAGIDLYTPSLPWIATTLHASHHLVKLTISAYVLGYAIGPLFAGSATDVYGRKPILQFGALLYIFSCFIIILVQDIHMMIWMRVLQGISAGLMGVACRAMITDNFPMGPALKKMSASTALAWSLGPILAPFIGGYLQHYFGWVSNFYFYILYTVGILSLSVMIPETQQHKQKWHVKTMLGHYRTILSNKVFWGAAILAGVVYGMIILFNIVAPFLIQSILHYNAVEFGYIALAMGFAFFLGNISNRLLVHSQSLSRLIMIGLFSSILMSTVFLLLGIFFTEQLLLFTMPVFIVLFSGSFIFPNAISTVLGLFPKIAGTAGAMIGFAFSIITSVISIVGSFLLSSSQVPMAIAYVILSLIGFVVYTYFLKPFYLQCQQAG